MKRFLLFFMLISLMFFAFSCGGGNSEPQSSDVNTVCNSNEECSRNSYCDLEHPRQDEMLGTLVYYCKKRTICASQADCPMGWKCQVSENFCITEKEAESLWCKSDTDCTNPNYPKCDLGSGECKSPDGSSSDSGDSGLPDSGDSGLPEDNDDSSETNDSDSDSGSDNDTSDSGSETNDHDTDTDTDNGNGGSSTEQPKGETLITEDFEDGGSNWTIVPAVAENPCWQIGVPTSGPEAAHGGENVAATILEGEYPNECKDLIYYNDEFTVPSSGVPTISFYAYVDIVGTGYSPYDYVEVLAKKSNDMWETTTGLYLSAETPSTLDALDNKRTKITKPLKTNYYKFSAKLSDFKGQTVQIGFRFVSDTSDTAMGFYLDDIEVSY